MLAVPQRESLDSNALRQEKRKLAIVQAPERQSLSQEAMNYFAKVTQNKNWRHQLSAYLDHSKDYLSKVIPANKKVLLISCLGAEVLDSLQPSYGVCLEVSDAAVRLARTKSTRPNQHFYRQLPDTFESSETFDYVVLLNYLDHSEDILTLVESLRRFVHQDSRIVISMLNPMWHRFVQLASRANIRVPDYRRNLIACRAIKESLEIKQFKVMDTSKRVLVPKAIPGLARFVNHYLARLPFLNRFCFLQYITAAPTSLKKTANASCSVIIPCYNEEGNIEECIRRVPQMGSFTEIVVVNDGSKDRTVEIANSLKPEFPNLNVVTYEKNAGKGNAVLQGIRASKGDVMMILDADMTVPPEELTDFYDALESQAADFASGTRFVYPMEKEAMRFANYLGNQMFSKLVEWIVGSECTDTLCGTKAMRKRDFENFRLEDPKWGDFDLIFHAARHKLKSIQVPVHYKSRVAGESKMKAFSAGISFLKLCLRKWIELP